jgi:hypothetical protein
MRSPPRTATGDDIPLIARLVDDEPSEDSNVAISDSNAVLHHQQRIHHGKPSKFEQATSDAETQSAAIMPENWLSIDALANQAPP